MNHTRSSEIVRGLGALLLFGVLLLGFPIGLYAVAGSPIPNGAPSWDQVTTAVMLPDTDHRLFLGAVRLLGWAAWLLFTVVTCIETVGYLAGRTTPSLPRPARPMQTLARDMIAAATLLFSTGATLTSPASAAVHTATADARPATADRDAAETGQTAGSRQEWEPLLSDTAPTHHAEPAPEDQRIRIVEGDDTLWDIAERAYGSGSRYPEIFEASRTVDQPIGVPPLTDPDRLYPGQHLRVPHPEEHDSAPKEARERPPSKDTNAPRPPRDEASPPASTDPTPDEQTSAAEHTSSPSQVPSPVVAPPPQQAAGESPSSAPSAEDPANEDDESSAITLRSGSYIGLGLAAALSIALAATRLHRRRRHRPDHTEPPAPVAEARKAHLDTYTEHEAPVPSDAELLEHDRSTSAPDHIAIGVRAGTPVIVPLPGLNIGLTGESAPAVARALATELLAKAPRDRVELIIPQPDLEVVYPGFTVRARPLPGLTITPSTSAAIAHLEAEVMRRARLLETTEEPDLAALRAADPAEPLPTLLLAASVPEHDVSTLQAIIQLGHRYGIGALILGPWPTGTSLHLADDATVTDAQGPHAGTLADARLFHLTTDDALGMLRSLHTAIGATEAPDQPETPTPGVLGCEQDVKVAPIPAPRPAADELEEQRPVRLQLLGPVRLATADGPINTGLRRSARELLAYLALYPDGVTRDQAIDALWPDHAPEAAATLFQTAVGNIRKVLRAATDVRAPMFVLRAADRYRLDPHLIDVDLWRLANTLTQARQATTDTGRIQALQPVIALYTADFADDLTHAWAEAHREHLRRTALDALARLAQLLQDDAPDQALAALEHAIAQDPYAEPLYRTIMELQARLGRPDAVKRTYRLLTEHLTTLDAEPDDETHQLLAELQRPHSR